MRHEFFAVKASSEPSRGRRVVAGLWGVKFDIRCGMNRSFDLAYNMPSPGVKRLGQSESNR
jgi:hypothetical protein